MNPNASSKARESRLNYTGRFAPSPTGPLHFGSAIAAVASYLDAKHHGGRWLIRIDDIDPPREHAGAASAILRTLEALGLEWDGDVAYQSEQTERYEMALATLAEAGASFECGCTRREIGGLRYPGTCRNGLPRGKHARSIRLRVPVGEVEFVDGLQGLVSINVAENSGDFVLRRADGLFAYHLANVVDDAAMAISHIVRGIDLIDSTPRQICLQQALKLPTPHYVHFPVALNDSGKKLSKQTQAPAINPSASSQVLNDVLGFLGHEPPIALNGAPCAELLSWVKTTWTLQNIPLQSRNYVKN